MSSASDGPRQGWWSRTVSIAYGIKPVAEVIAAVAGPLALTAAILPFRSQGTNANRMGRRASSRPAAPIMPLMYRGASATIGNPNVRAVCQRSLVRVLTQR
jgi:hypothetical protein